LANGKTMLEQLQDELLLAGGLQEDRKASPSAIALDSQSVKVTSFVGEDPGIDGNKGLNGRKRPVAVDALGYPLALVVRGADVSESEAGKILADRVSTKLTDWSTPYQLATHTGRAIRTVL
jgi:hypothetical protein